MLIFFVNTKKGVNTHVVPLTLEKSDTEGRYSFKIQTLVMQMYMTVFIHVSD